MHRFVFAAVLGVATSAAAQSGQSIVGTTSLLIGCRALVEDAPSANPMQTGACAGAVKSAIDIGRMTRRSCPPSDDLLAAARVVIVFADDNAKHRAEPFGVLALQALERRWPCR
ncbi:MAG: Rap1a/Tai family immunity protein [Acetobacteraceae bacterium]